MADPGTCRSCGAPVRWVRTERGLPMPVDPEPTERGNIVLEGERALYVGPADMFDSRPRYLSHFATCPQAASHRKRR